ncbi:hypothetical protein G7Z12_27955 [Streptomyces sp. ID38640]|uniref:bifunctional metallophosphatase/5'-nucleotidase n=1 Tax=Streptomyces sp. ID38640 TaxID=1265399 RepID=UPI00140EE3B5|nr:5'-nucleotidase C-terminal domain-containing protein [Streptomyces sp. ID38640]QIK09304.1 hypothetical protein G7Z12_27955 [Streptomyces sp. ID38640]
MSLDRREFLGSSVVTGAGVALAGGAPTAEAVEVREQGGRGHGHGHRRERYAFTVMGTTDLHGNVFNWDYAMDAEFDDAAHNDVGLAKISTLVTQVRQEKGRHNTLLIDAGDTIQGTQLAYYYAKVDPITDPDGPVHPMARAMNAVGYDAAALGNHEFNYGIPVLRKSEESCDFPLLGANAVDARSLRPAFRPYVLKRLRSPQGRVVTVAVLGLTNPGIAIWDKAHVQGKLAFPGLVEQAAKWVPKLRSMGADVVFVAAHSGMSGTSSYGDQLPYVENAAVLVAEQVPVKDTPILDFIAWVQAEVVRKALAGSAFASLPVLSQASCFSRTARVPEGDVTIRSIAALYPFDNTLEARVLTGAQLRAYLEFSARYYVRTPPGGGPVDPSKVTNADGIPDYHYDMVYGVSYEVDIAKPAGQRIGKLMFDGKPLDDAARFVLAVNNYRASGGGNFPHVAAAEQVWSTSDEIRNVMIGWVQETGEIDPAAFAAADWKLTRDGVPVF